MKLSDPNFLVDFLRKNRLSLSRELGQNFLVDSEVLAEIITAAELKKFDNVVEIGAGIGTLTSELVTRVKKVTALEFDQKIFPTLVKNLSEFSNIELHNLDVRKFIPPKGVYKLVANIPYYLTSPILRQFFLKAENCPQIAVLLVQKEVAEKICNIQKLSPLALEVCIFASAEIVCFVSRKSFLPPPKVESAVIKIVLKKSPEIPQEDIVDFFKVIHAGFRAPRKKIRGSLAAGLSVPKKTVKEVLLISEVDTEKRPENLTIKEWQKILMAARRLSAI